MGIYEGPLPKTDAQLIASPFDLRSASSAALPGLTGRTGVVSRQFQVLSPEIERAVDAKAGAIVSLRHAWLRAASRAFDSGLDERSLLAAIGVFSAPGSLLKLSESVGRTGEMEGGSLLETLERYAAESDFSVNEWLSGLERLLQFLIQKNRSAAMDKLCGYLHCAAESLGGSEPSLSFRESIDAFLDEFGFDG